jgi:predicted SAM-dependent methyltransferase
VTTQRRPRRPPATAELRLNLGSGVHPTPPGWVSVDVDPRHQPDVVADVADLPYPTASAARLYAGHMAEHLPLDVLGAVLAEWRRVLAPGGVLMLVGPDIDRAVEQRSPQWLLEAIVAHGDGPGAHQWTCSERVVLWLMRTHGWEAEPVDVATVTPPTWPNPCPTATWQYAIRCRSRPR